MYTAYASNYNVALEVLRKLRDTPKTSDLLEDLRKKAGNDIEAFLIKPVQRIPRYELLLRDLLKHTVDSHPDYKNIEDSLNKMKDIAGKYFKSTLIEIFGLRSIFQSRICNDLDFNSMLIEDNFNL
jgi:hypothetical protein